VAEHDVERSRLRVWPSPRPLADRIVPISPKTVTRDQFDTFLSYFKQPRPEACREKRKAEIAAEQLGLQ
jgi:hypothetical protein